MATEGLAYRWPPEIGTGGTFTLGTATDAILKGFYFPTSIAATANVTLAPATASAAGTLGGGAITGALTRTLAPAVGSGVGKLTIRAATSRTLAPATGAATARLAIAGTTSRTLAPATGFGVAQLAIRGYLGATLAPATTSAAGEQILPTIMGSVSITLAGATLLAFGRRVYPLAPGARVSDALARKTAEANPRLAARANAAIRTVTARPGRAIAYAKKRG